MFLSNNECDHFSTSKTTTMTTILYSLEDRSEACDFDVAINVSVDHRIGTFPSRSTEYIFFAGSAITYPIVNDELCRSSNPNDLCEDHFADWDQCSIFHSIHNTNDAYEPNSSRKVN